ncbi:MAG TPA: hypothetical protein VGD65_14700 [Chryseosolibacter sp.]
MNVQPVFDFTPAEIMQGKYLSLASAAERLKAQSRQISEGLEIGCHASLWPGFMMAPNAVMSLGGSSRCVKKAGHWLR